MSTIGNRPLRLLCVAFALITGVCSIPQRSFAVGGSDPEDGCRISHIVGRYGFLANGNTIGQGTATPYASGGVMTFHANGTLSIDGTQSDNGVVTPFSPSEATFVLNSKCRGSVSVNGQPLFDFVVIGAGEEIDLIRSDLGVVITGYAKRVAERCTLSNVRNSYGYAFNAIVFNIPINNMIIPFAFFAGGGVVQVQSGGNGADRAILDDTASFGGFVLARHYEGVVSVNPDCTGTAVVTLPPNAPTSTNPVHINAVWVDHRKSVLLIQTDPGTFISGEAKRVQRLKR